MPGLDYHLMAVRRLACGAAQRPNGGRNVLTVDLPENPVLSGSGRDAPGVRRQVATVRNRNSLDCAFRKINDSTANSVAARPS